MFRIRLLFLSLLFLYNQSLTGQTLTLYAIPPPQSINWKSPHQLALSMVRNFLVKKEAPFPTRPMGHIIVELEKDGDTVLTAIVANTPKDFFSAILREKYGLGVLFKLFEGHLEKKEALLPEIEHRENSGKIAFITFTITDSSYGYLKNYVDSFRLLGYDKLYNGLNDPRHGEGSGCSAFGVSFLELIHVLDPEFTREWSRDIAIPDKLIGGEMTGNRVSLVNVFFSCRWAKDIKKHTHLRLYDPELVYAWIQKKYQEVNYDPTGPYIRTSRLQAKGILVECRQISRPQFPMFIPRAAEQ
jgi:hypothetical protein